MHNSDEKLGTQSIAKLIFTMGMPAIAAQVINLLYSIVDRIYIGHIEEVGAAALTGVGLSMPIIVIISAFSAFVCGGGAPLAAIALGREDRKRSELILGNGVTMLLFFSVVLTVLFLAVKEPVLYLIGASANTFDYANDYLTIYLLGTVFVQMSVGLNSFITAQGRAGIAMLSTLIGAATNLTLDPLFIFTFKMGVEGAAIATIISQACSAVWITVFLCSDKASLRIKPACLKPDIRIIGSIAALGIAPFVMTATESVISIVMNSGLRNYGGDMYVGALTVAQSTMQFITVPVSGFSQGVTPILSYNFGAGNKQRVKKAFKQMFIALVSYTSTLAVLIMVKPRIFAVLFSDNEELTRLSEKVLPVFVAGMLIFGIQRACQTAFLAMGQAKTSLLIALLRKVFLLVPLALILPRFMGVMGIYYAEPIADTLAALTCGSIFIYRFNKILNKESNPAGKLIA